MHFYRKKITDQLGPTIKLVFIPTTLYELFVLDLLKDIMEDYSTRGKAPFDGLMHFMGQQNNTDKVSLAEKIILASETDVQEFQSLYATEQLQNLHYRTNTHSAQKIVPQDISREPFTLAQTSAHSLTTNLLATLSSSHFDWINFLNYHWPANAPPPLVDESIGRVPFISLENDYAMYQTGGHCAYRDGSRKDSPVSQDMPVSLSFGTTLLSGIIFDKGGNPLSYIAGNLHKPSDALPHNYYVVLDKFDYFTGISKKFFYIPPISTIVGLLSSGEFFHTRGKIYPEQQNSLYIRGICFSSQSETHVYVKGEITKRTLVTDTASVFLGCSI
jgi:hypothetical protein